VQLRPRPRARGRSALALPVGDALIQPSWKDAQGINVGFQTALNAVWVAACAREWGLEPAVVECRFAYALACSVNWRPEVLQPRANWTADYLTRLDPGAVVAAQARIAEAGGPGKFRVAVPPRLTLNPPAAAAGRPGTRRAFRSSVHEREVAGGRRPVAMVTSDPNPHLLMA